MSSTRPLGARPLIVPMTARAPDEAHRVATPLELFFDLVFVVAIAEAGHGLHHAIAEGHVVHGLVGYGIVFFGIWWAWMNFTWFASAYDNDDVPYRLLVFLQISGALVFAAGVPASFEAGGVGVVVVVGYVIMRVAGVAQWVRAAQSDPARRTTALRYAGGIVVVQGLWVGLLFAPASLALLGFVVLAIVELAVPVWAERAEPTTWHPHHITERYGLLTIIVLGESILTATNAIDAALSSGEAFLSLAPIVVGGLLLVFALWWLYFDRPVHDLLEGRELTRAIVWGYGHYVVFASIAAVGAGFSVAVDQATQDAHVSALVAGEAVAIPVAVFTASLWLLHRRPASSGVTALGPVAVVLVLLAPLLPWSIVWIAATLVVLSTVKRLVQRRA